MCTKYPEISGCTLSARNQASTLHELTLRRISRHAPRLRQVTQDMDRMAFNTAISALMQLTNHLMSLEAVPRAAPQKS